MSLALPWAPERRLALPVTWIAAAALVAVAALTQARYGMMADVSWLIDCDERWLDGAVPYRDFIETNPPASLWLYLPAVAAGRALHVSSEFAVSVFGFALAAAALALSAGVLRRVKVEPALGLAAVLALVVLPGQTFGERDHFAAILGFPFVALIAARAEGARVNFALALAAGLAAGAMAAVKPPYALIGALPALFVLARRGWRETLTAPEYYAAAAVALGYLVSVRPLFPDYAANVLPFLVDVYLPLREGLGALIASPGALAAVLIGVCAAVNVSGPRPALAAFGLAALGAGLAFLVQGKGWVYQAVPASLFATVAGAAVVPLSPALGLAAFVAAAAAPTLGSHGIGWLLGIAAGFGFEAALSRDARPTRERLAPLAFAAAVGAACGLCLIERPLTPKIEASLKALGPGLTLGSISEDEGLAFPLVREIGGRWVMRAHSLIVSAAARRLASMHPGDAALAAKIAPYPQRDREIMLEDIARQKPDALLVGPLKSRLHADLWADARVQAALADYRRLERDEGPDYAAEVWVRKDRR